MSIILRALREARSMIETERAAFIDCHTLPNGGLEPDDQAIRQEYDDVLALVRDAIAAMETPKPVAFITRESMMRLSNGGNDSRGTVPAHRRASAIANRPLYLHPTVPEVAR